MHSYEEYISQPREISTFAAYGSFILGTGIVELVQSRWSWNFDKLEADSLQVQNDLDRYVMKELEILDKNNLFWGYHLQEGYEKRVELCRYAPKESSPKRKAQKEVWRDLIEQVVQEVVG